ncbi:hypothetical protein LX36DRAFT_710360 [Colletotrichum falcatum]|nr:hypothetical protein LX36DRAFT_710360 [Colletotrichum falcatum]
MRASTILFASVSLLGGLVAAQASDSCCNGGTNDPLVTQCSSRGLNTFCALATGCPNLRLGIAYCVHGPASVAARATGDAKEQYSDNLEAQCRRNRAGPAQTSVPGFEDSGVALGWPGADSPKLKRALGLPVMTEL